ncbi:MAG: hypothetical protein KJI72_00035 [Patescibacteria group bacterium]|nr:hypothetical protein [Patescibacteria group bacterium]
MFKFIIEMLIMVSLGTILYLLARTMPRVDDRETDIPSLKTHWIMGYLEKADQRLKFYWEKTLRRSGIVILKLDNAINKKLSRLKKENAKESTFSITETEGDKKEDKDAV